MCMPVCASAVSASLVYETVHNMVCTNHVQNTKRDQKVKIIKISIFSMNLQ